MFAAVSFAYGALINSVGLGTLLFAVLVLVYGLVAIRNWLKPEWTPIAQAKRRPDCERWGAEPPGGYLWPVIGNAIRMFSWGDRQLDLNIDAHREAAESNHDIFSFKIFHIYGVSSCDPEHVKHVYHTNFQNYVKGQTMQYLFRPFFGNGIFAVNGNEWKHQRDVAKPLFRQNSLQEMVPVFVKDTAVFLKKLSTAVETPVDIQNLFMRFTLDTFTEIGFGHNANSLTSETGSRFAPSFDYIQFEIFRRAMNPLREYFTKNKFNRALQDVDEFVYKIIADRRKEPVESLTGKRDLLSRYLLMTGDDIDSASPEVQDGTAPQQHALEATGTNGYSDQYLRDILMNFVIAGRDTTAILMTWTVYSLCKHKDIEAKVMAEIDSVLQGCQPTWEDVKKLKYLRAVLDETLRLYPPVPANYKQAAEDDVLPGGYVIRKGTEVALNAYTIHRLEKYWGSDALEYRPERWLVDGFRQSMHPYQYFPFHAGPRVCLGKTMALTEAAILLASIYQKYTLQLVPGQNIVYALSLTMPAKTTVMVKAVPRDDLDHL
eukprot:TRINITY_DN722_c0_g1_i1.p1 TRINITY_DN722_c0_g1~~TRINITY_DN722_c0_g1_i1.p1  ORF type:complete len:545 (-),score=100.57 TRINITY_DN722_c0_g1_i1:97-1731(-)